MAFLKNDSELLTISLVPEKAVVVAHPANDHVTAAANVYNRLGCLLARLSIEYRVDVASVIAIWVAQTGGRIFTPKRASLYFEVQRFFSVWGHRYRQEFDTYFRFGGFNLQQGQPWENHEYREDSERMYRGVHHNQNSEYAALTMARTLAGDSVALTAACVGGCLLSVAEFSSAGYGSPIEMFDAFQESERTHVIGFFDYCAAKPAPKTKDLIRYLRARDWEHFAMHYPAADQTPMEVRRLQSAYASAKAMMSWV